ncbi:MAG: LysM peptidoglycan-binding domain-containing protein [Chthoniobacterales bacterium]
MWKIFLKAQSARLLITCGFLLTLNACDQISKLNLSSQDTKKQALDAANAGDFPKAVRLYEQGLDGTSRTADLHYRLAIIYDGHLSDPTSALHHFRRYLRMAEPPTQKDEVTRAIARIERDFLTRNSSGLVTKREAASLRNENAKLRQEIAKLRGDVSAAKTAMREARSQARSNRSSTKPGVDSKGFSTVPKTREAELKTGSETRTYTVQAGDTLAGISRKFYKTSTRWQDISDANYNQLGGKTVIREGMVLIIPQ